MPNRAAVVVMLVVIDRQRPVATTAGGYAFVDDAGPRIGTGRLRTYRLEVEPATGVDTRAFTYLAERILSDERGWTSAGDWSLRLQVKPLVRLIWLGALVMLLGGMLAASDRRYRRAKARAAATATQPAEA